MTKKYCAFLRGVNVNGIAIKMTEAAQVFENSDMRDVCTVLASGNIVFSSEEKVEYARAKLKKALSEHFSYEAFLFLKSKEDLMQISDSKPFVSDANLHCYVFIAENGFVQELLSRFKTIKPTENEKAEVVNGNFYWQVPKVSTLDTEFSKIIGQKSWKDKFTSRNINTIEKVLKKM